LKTQRLLGKLVAGALVGALSVAYAPRDANAQGTKPVTTAAPKPATPPPAPAAAGGGAKPADPKALYADGEKKYKAADFAGALTSFQAVDALKSTPQSQRYIGLCQDNLGHYPEAVAAYEKFLAAPPPKMTKEADELKKRVDTIKAMPGKVHVDSTPGGASIVADGKPMGTTPSDIELAPGKHTIHLELNGYLAIDKEVDVGYASKQDLKSELSPKPVTTPPPVAVVPPPTDKPAEPPPKPAEPPKEPRSKVPAFITGGLAVAAAGVGTVFGILALGKQSDFKTAPSADTADTGENFALVADMSFGVAITLGITSAVLFLTNDDEPAKAASTLAPKKAASPFKGFTAAPFMTPHGGGAGAVFRF